MEQECKWLIPKESLPQLAQFLENEPGRQAAKILRMEAIYYDTPENLLRQKGVALRIRRENDRAICCMKRTLLKYGAQAIREEYETEAETPAEGLKKLPECGAPKELCELLAVQEFREIARTSFTRTCYLIAVSGTEEEAAFTAEFAVDVGELGNSGNMVPFEEIEFELKSGSEDHFSRYAEMLQKRFSLTPQKASKLARAAGQRPVEMTTPHGARAGIDHP